MEDPIARARHAARGCLNALKLCVSALELPCTFEEEMEFIDDIIRATDKLPLLVDELDALHAGESVENA